MDHAKPPQFVRKVIEGEMEKGHEARSVLKMVNKLLEENKEILGDQPPVKPKLVHNVGQKFNNAGLAALKLAPGANLEDDLTATINLLREKGWKAESSKVEFEGKDCELLVFACEKHLEHLKNYGVLVLFDATHKTNVHNWYLFALTVRDKYGEWQRGGYFFCNHQNQATIKEGLKKLKEWAQGQWKAYYFVVDDSAAEKLGIKGAFPGLQEGEQEVKIFNCTVHSMRTLNNRLGSFPEPLRLMRGAMQRTTRANCEAMIQEAIGEAKVSWAKKYIESQWQKHPEEWALFARQHSSLLLQVTTTNPAESHFRQIKRKLVKG